METPEKTEGLLAIKQLAEEDRPREKMLQKGRAALTDAELLAILIGSGTPGESAVFVAQKILKSADNNLHELGKQTIKELQKHKGIGEAKAITIAAALELGRRRQVTEAPVRVRIQSSADIYHLISPTLEDLRHEEFWVIYLSRSNHVMGKEQISTGGATGTVVDLKLLFKRALEANATQIVAVHNHPSGNLRPSESDISLTNRMVSSGRLLEIPVVDHLIVSELGYFSFADEGML